jgi:RHS repeat-associated protein
MGTTIKNKDVATKQSGHGCVSPPEMSISPPTPPAGPVPLPYVYTARSATAVDTEAAYKRSESECLVKGSTMDVDKPGNQPAQPVQAMGGGDVVTHAICGIAVMAEGSAGTSSGDKPVCKTMDNVRLAIVMKEQRVCQATVPLLLAGDGAFASDKGGGGAKNDEKVKAALLAQAAKRAGKSSGPPKPEMESDPIAVVTGHVIDGDLDLALPGVIPLEWRRSYSSARARERGALGRGGWVHNLEQWVVPEAEVLVFRAGDGRDVYFPKVEPGASAFHRRERLTLSASRAGGFSIHDHASHRVFTFAAPDGRAGRAMLHTVSDSYGHEIRLEYRNGLLSRVVDTAGRELVVKSDDRGRIIRVEVWASPPPPRLSEGQPNASRLPAPSLQQWFEYRYHPEGELSGATDAVGLGEQYEYDGHHRMVKKVLRNGVAFRYEFDDDLGWCVRAYGDGGLREVTLTPDLKKGRTMVGGCLEPKVYVWNEDRVVVRRESIDEGLIIERTFDDDLFPLSEKNGAGDTTTYEYDERGNFTKLVDPAGNETAWVYADDRPVKRVAPGGLVTRFVRDGHGALVGIETPTGDKLVVERDTHGRAVAIHDASGLLTGRAYDDHHNLVHAFDRRGARLWYAYDAMGRVVARVDAQGNRTRAEYDAAGRLTAIVRPDGAAERFEHDALGKLSRYTDVDGNVTAIEHSGTGVRTAVTTPDGQRWTFDHDDEERLSRVKNPRGEVYEFEYDRRGLIERERTFDGRILEFSYDLAGRLSRIGYPDETYREFEYDERSAVVLERSPHGTLRYERDPLGRLLKATVDEVTGEVVTSFERDAFGRIVRETQGARSIAYAYDAKGRRTSRTLQDGPSTSYFYDELGALTALDHAGYRLLVERDSFGAERRTHLYSGGVDILTAQDAAGGTVARQVTAPRGKTPQILSEQRFGYGRRRLERVDDREWGTTLFQHDAQGRLVAARAARSSDRFEYDVGGSLVTTTHETAAGTTDVAFASYPGNVLAAATGIRFEHDERGRRTKKIEAGGSRVTQYLWDCRDRLREVRLPSGERVLFTYDAFGRRVRKAVVSRERADYAEMVRLALREGKEALPKPRVTEYLWDGDLLAAEVDADAKLHTYVHDRASMAPLLQSDGSQTFAYVNDHLGVPRALVDEGGRLAWSAAHSAWGDVLATSGDPEAARPKEPPFRLLGQHFDPETGLCFTRFRYFDPATARWCSPDPLGFAASENLFAWNGSPVASVDPLGLAMCPITRTRDEALQEARARAGLARDAEPVEQFTRGPGYPGTGNAEFEPVTFSPDDSVLQTRSKLGELGPVEVHFDPNNPDQAVVVVNHSADPNNPPHVHAGTIDINNTHGTYANIPGHDDHHIYYKP